MSTSESSCIPKNKFSTCLVCLQEMKFYYLTNCCGHLACYTCIKKIHADTKPCPICKASSKNVFLAKNQKKKLARLNLYCASSTNVCNTQTVVKVDPETQNLTTLTTARAECSSMLVNCDLCGAKVAWKNLAKHTSKSCPKRPFDCQYCHHSSTYTYISQIHSHKCPKYPVRCSKCDSDNIERAQLAIHFSKCTGPQKINCEYKKYGCKELMLPKKLSDHYKEKVHFHLDLVTKHNQEVTRDLSKVQKQIDILKTTANKQPCLYTQVKFSIFDFSSLKDVRLQGGPVMYTRPAGYKLQVCIFFQGTKLNIELWHVETHNDKKLKWPLHCTLTAILRDSMHEKNCLRRSRPVVVARGSYNTSSEICIAYSKIDKCFCLDDVLNFEVDVVV